MIFPTPISIQTPADVRVQPINGALVVEAKVGGVPGRFVVNTGTAPLYVDPAFLKRMAEPRTAANVEIGGAVLGRGTPLEADVAGSFPGADGIIGVECLAGAAVGVDFDGRRMRVWPRGSSPAEAREWIHAAVPGARIGSLPMDLQAGIALVRARIGKKVGRFAFDTSTVVVEVRRSMIAEAGAVKYASASTTMLDDPTPQKVDVLAAEGFRFGEIVPTGTIVRRRESDEPILPLVDGIVSPRGLPARRIVVDFKNARLDYDVPTVDESIGRTMGRLLQLPLRVEGEKIVFAAPANPDVDPVALRLIGAEFLEFEGTSSIEILRAMRTAGSARTKFLARFGETEGRGFDGKILLNERVREFNTRPAGD